MKNLTSSFVRRAAVAAGLVTFGLCVASPGWAADKTWVGGVDDSWATAGFGGPGGGAIWIETKSSFCLAGSLIADGQGSTSGSWTSSGSGGAVYIKCRHWRPTETAVVRAQGGTMSSYGGGGCVAIWRAYDHDLTSTNERAYVSAPAGGYGNTIQKATDGTIYWGDLPRPGITVLVR